MKKLMTGVIAAAALLFGFASCSGDLHDNRYSPIELSGLKVCGGWNSWTGDLVTGLSGTSVVYDNVTPTADDDKLVFVITDGSSTYYKTLTAGTLPDGMGVGGVDDGNGGKNGCITGFKKDYTYKVTADTSTGNVVVSVEITKSPAPAAAAVPEASKLVKFVGNVGEKDVVWNGNVGTVTIEKGATNGWAAGSPFGANGVEFAIAEDSSWTGKFCGVALADEGTAYTLESGAGNASIPYFSGKTATDKNCTITFTILPAGTWKGENNNYTSDITIEASYTLSD